MIKQSFLKVSPVPQVPRFGCLQFRRLVFPLFNTRITAIQWCECYACCDWSLSTIYWSTDTWMMSRETCFLCFVQHGAQFWKCIVRLFRIKASKSLGKSLAGAIAKKKNWKKGDPKKLLITWECLNDKKSSKQLPSCVIAGRETRCFAGCFRHYSALSKKRRWKTFRRNCIQVS